MTNINGLSPTLLLAPANKPDTSDVSQAKNGFGNVLKSTVEAVNSSQIASDQAIVNLQSGEAKNLHEVMIAVEQADVSLRMLVQMRNKALSAYEEIMRMQI